MPLPTIPSSDLVLRTALLAQSVLTATVLGTNIRTRRPTTWPNAVILVLTVISENELRPECNRCRVQADLFGAGTDASSAAAIKPVAAVLQSVSRDCDGDYSGTDDVGNNWTGKIRNCSAPDKLPSPEPDGRSRIIIDFVFDLTQ
jgi:hypothetical protein